MRRYADKRGSKHRFNKIEKTRIDKRSNLSIHPMKGGQTGLLPHYKEYYSNLERLFTLFRAAL